MRTRTQTPVPDVMIGRTILEFRIERKLAEGGMGAVYLARHVRLPSTLKVIKVLLPEYAENRVLRQRFHREAEAASKLKHDCILGIDNFGALDDGQLFLMIPYLEGQPLDAYLRSRGGRLAPHRALHLVVQLCDALDHAHALGIVHRDLKPGNVYVVPTNANPYALKLLDFGIAKIVGGEDAGPRTHSGVAIGTPSYMAVEQYEHADQATHLADVYSLAIMIWEMATGRLPWQHPDPAILYFQQRTVIPDRPPADVMPPEWADLLLAAVSVDPAARPQSARELAVGLASALPAVGRVPSGAEILAGLAPHFVRTAAPDDETVRNASDVDRIGPLLWPPRETAPDAPRELPRPKDHVGAGTADAPARELAAAPSRKQRSHADPPSAPTTLSAATGVASRPGERRGPRWKLGLVAAGTAALAAIATGGIAASVSSGALSGSAPAPSPALAPATNLAIPASAPTVPTPASAPTVPTSASAPKNAAPASALEVAIDPSRSRAPTARTMDARPALLDERRAARANPGAPAPGTPATPPTAARRSFESGAVAKPAVPAASGARRASKAAIDPDDVSGPEE